MIKRIALLVFLFVMCSLLVRSQETDFLVNQLEGGTPITEILIPLSDMQFLAVQNSPLLKFYNSDILIRKLKIKMEKRDWMSTLYIEASAKYGLFDNLLITEDLNTESITSSTEQTRYTIGLMLRIPISKIVDRTNVKLAKEELENIRYRKENSARELRQLVIVQYNNVLKSYSGFDVRNRSLGVLNMHLDLVEKEFLNGKIHIAEYSRVNEIKMNTEIEFEEVKIELTNAIQILSEIVGKEVIIKN